MGLPPEHRALRAGRDVAAFGLVALLHGALIALLVIASGTMRRAQLPFLPALLLPAPPRASPPPPPLPRPVLQSPPAPAIPLPDIRIAAPPEQAISRRIARVPAPPAGGHFGAAAGDTGLGLDVAAGGGGGAGARGALADFEAEVKRRILAGKRQPALAWDRRNTCVVNYTVRIGAGGALAGFTIDPCAVPEINAAARRAIAQAAPFPRPPLGPAAVHGTLIFRPES